MPFYEIVRENMVEPERLEIIIGHMRFACWITKDIDINSKYVILISFKFNNGYAKAL